MSIYKPFIDTVATGIRNPYGLAAVAATGRHESGYSPKNAFGAWSDPSESGQAGTAGGILSWRAERLQRLQQFAAENGDDPSAPSPEIQGQFFLQEDPALVERLNSAGSVEEAQSLMNNAWKFAGYNREGGEAANRLATARSILGGAEIEDGSGGTSTRELNMGSATMASGYPTPVGGLGGLGGMPIEEEPEQGGIAGFFNNPGVADTLRAVGLSMMSSPSNNWMQDVGTYLPQLERSRLLQEAVQREQGEKQQTRGAWNSALRLSGLSDEEADLMSTSPDAAAYAIKARTTNAETNKTKSYLQASYPDLYDAVEAGRPITDALAEANERRKAGLKSPELEEIYDDQGLPQKGFFRGDQFIPVGGTKAPASDGAAKLPSGFMPDPNDPSRLTPIPGGPGEQISGELAARVGLAKNFLNEAPELQKRAKDGEVTGVYDQMVANSFSGTGQAGVLRGWMSGVDALQRMLTGAGQTESEARAYVQRYLPTYTDTAESASDKIGQLQTELQSIEEEVMRGRGGTGRGPGAAAPAAPASAKTSSGVTWKAK